MAGTAERTIMNAIVTVTRTAIKAIRPTSIGIINPFRLYQVDA